MMSVAAPNPASRPGNPPIPETPTRPLRYWRRRMRLGLAVTLAGFIIFLVGARPGLFSLDRSPVIGFVQIAMFLVGLAIICIGGFVCLRSLWKEQSISISADVGQRMVATGYVIAVFTGMADIFGLGSHPLPGVPYFGEWQARGVELGMGIIAIGFLMMLPGKNPSSGPPK